MILKLVIVRRLHQFQDDCWVIETCNWYFDYWPFQNIPLFLDSCKCHSKINSGASNQHIFFCKEQCHAGLKQYKVVLDLVQQ